MSRARILADYVSSGDELADKAPIASPTFTGTVAIPNVANLETAVVANTAKVTNATHTGEVTGATSLTIADNAVTLAKMAGGTDGQIITYDASGDPIAVGPGTDGQVLTSTGATSPPAFEDASSFNADAAQVFNESGNNVDFRVETSGNTNTLFVNGGSNSVLIGGTNATFGLLGIESTATGGLPAIDLFSNVGSGTVGNAEIFFSTDTSSDHVSCCSIKFEQETAGARKGEMRFKTSDNGGPITGLTIYNNQVVYGNFSQSSDENLKKNIEDLGSSTDVINALRPRKFDWEHESTGLNIAGFIAQEVAAVIPTAVSGRDYVADIYYEDGDDMPEETIVGDIKIEGDRGKGLDTTAILAYVVKTIQELSAKITALESADE